MNDNKILKQLTLDVINARKGIAVNRRWCLVLDRSPILKDLLKKGLIYKVRENHSNMTSYTMLYPTTPEEREYAVCKACGGRTRYLPEISMADHKKDCRLRVYYDNQ